MEAYDDGYFVKATPRASMPVSTPRVAPARKSYGWLGRVALLLALVGGAWFAFQALRPATPGSRDDLAGRMSAFTPTSMHRTKEFYSAGDECPIEFTCPSYTAYFAIDGPVGVALDEVMARLEQRGLDVRPNSVEPNLIVANDTDYIYFFVFHEPPFDGPFDDKLPRSVEADVVVSLKQPPPEVDQP